MLISEEIKRIIKDRCYREAKDEVFVLSSARRSRYYIDLKQAMFHPPTLALLADTILGHLQSETPFPDGVGGMTLGADPLAYSVSLAAHKKGMILYPFVVRKEPKGHGTNRVLEGLVEPGQRVVVLEDVATTGRSAATAVNRCREAGLEVLYVLAVVDREEGASELMARLGVPLHSLITLSELRA